MKQLDSIDSLNAIRQKVSTRQTDFNKRELDQLEEVYAEIQEKFVRKKNVTLDKGCASCISSAANIVFNYISFHEPKTIEIEKPLPTEKANIVIKEVTGKELEDLSLKDLRKLYPNIKARSVKEFIHELKQEQNGTSNEDIPLS